MFERRACQPCLSAKVTQYTTFESQIPVLWMKHAKHLSRIQVYPGFSRDIAEASSSLKFGIALPTCMLQAFCPHMRACNRASGKWHKYASSIYLEFSHGSWKAFENLTESKLSDSSGLVEHLRRELASAVFGNWLFIDVLGSWRDALGLSRYSNSHKAYLSCFLLPLLQHPWCSGNLIACRLGKHCEAWNWSWLLLCLS